MCLVPFSFENFVASNSEYFISHIFIDGNKQLFTASPSFVIGPPK